MAKRGNAEETPRGMRTSGTATAAHERPESDVREATPRRARLSDTVKRDEATSAYGTSGFDARIDELRRLYAAGEMDAAADLARVVSPPSPGGFSLASIPVVAVDAVALRALPLDHRAGFVLANVDGHADLETVLDLTAMPLEESLGVLEHLLALGAIRLLPPRD